MNSNTASIIASVFTALATIVIGYVGYSVKADSERTVEAIRSQTALQQSLMNSQYQARQLDIEMVKLALNILGGDISDKTNQSRQFAVQVLQRYSGVELKDEVVAEWVKTGTVAFKLPDQGLSSGTWKDLLSERTAVMRQLENLGKYGADGADAYPQLRQIEPTPQLKQR
ncbi:hypothetical protein [Phyllobacterium zundukense]|uniref:Uncharacterized protein n=1 Tax=Phyllobacterium zundukense TaxID=1867719 RepID=A0ACD4D714_9HYPH|nr:hypothetical protein [Phyllobacterium zundukense]UXN61574.1 hypothetical protein N8E88_16065 [Phyllobacterium zundukense]